MLLLSLGKGMNFSSGLVYSYQNLFMKFYNTLIFLFAFRFMLEAQKTLEMQRNDATKSKSEAVNDIDNSMGVQGLQIVKE